MHEIRSGRVSVVSASVRQQGHRDPFAAAEQHRPRERLGAEPVAHLVERGVERTVVAADRRAASSWTARSSSRLATATPTSVRPRRSIIGVAAASRPRAVARIVCVCAVGRSSVCDRVAREKSSKRRRSTTVRPTRPAARSRRVTRSTSPTSAASSASADGRCTAERPLRADRAAPAARPHRPRVAVVGERVQVPARRPAEHRHEHRLRQQRDLPDRRDPARAQLPGGDGPDAPEPLDRQRVEEGQLACPAARPAARRASRPRSRPWRGTSSARRRP